MRNKNNLRVLRALHELPVCEGEVAPHQILSVSANVILSMIAAETMTLINPQVSRYRYLEELNDILQLGIKWDRLPNGPWIEYAKPSDFCGVIEPTLKASQLIDTASIKLIMQFMPTSNQDPVGVASKD